MIRLHAIRFNKKRALRGEGAKSSPQRVSSQNIIIDSFNHALIIINLQQKSKNFRENIRF